MVIRGVEIRPALFCAPMAGITHSAFRRLVGDFGGCGTFFTEMLSARYILHEDLLRSPSLRRSPGEKRLIYQLMVSDTDRLDRIIGRLAGIHPDGLDINLACYAPTIRQRYCGSELFKNAPVLATVLEAVRRCWSGLLTVKIRFGNDTPGWERQFAERLRIIEASGVDAVVLHPRFFEDRLKRSARHERLAWVASLTRLPIIANGDIAGAVSVRDHPAVFEAACALMVGRMAVVQPWLFAAWNRSVPVDRADVWRRFYDYTCSDFIPTKAIGRIKVFTEYFARNFRFGHSFYTRVQNAPNLDAVRECAEAFFATNPAVDPHPSVMGL